MADDLVLAATNEKLTEMDWTKNIEICELVAQDQRQVKDVVKAIKKRLEKKNANIQLYAVMLLEMLMNNIGENVHKQVVDLGILPILVKIVKKKTDFPVRERIFLLLDATQTSLGGARGTFPQYYNAYYDLVSAGVKFSQTSSVEQVSHSTFQPNNDNVSNGVVPNSTHKAPPPQEESQTVPESSIIKKASNALEVLKEVLDAVDSQHPEVAKDEFTLDLVEQCSFQKQRVMHLVMTSRDEKVVSRAIELNDQLQQVLSRHDALLSDRSKATSNHMSHEREVEYSNGSRSTIHNNISNEDTEDEEEAEQLFRRIRKGKAHARPEDDDHLEDGPPLGLLGSSIPSDRLNRPLIRPLSLEPTHAPSKTHHVPIVKSQSQSSESSHESDTHQVPLVNSQSQSSDSSLEPDTHQAPVAIPPPPARHVEREKFFKEKKVDGTVVTGHMRGLSLHSRNGSSSRSESVDFSD